MLTPTPFTIAIADERVADLRRRLANTRWPDASPAAAWEEGTDREYLQGLTEYWLTEFDWRACETALNGLAQYTTVLDGLSTHFIHQRGTGPTPFPLLLGHGWPSLAFDLRRLIPLLTDPGAHGADPADAFHVVAPSLPGYGFSQRPDRPGVGPQQVAGMWAELMAGLGYGRFGMHSGDWGAAVGMWLATTDPARLAGLHLNFVPGFFRPPTGPTAPPITTEEQAFLDELATWFDSEGGYHRLQSTKPQTPAYALTDSPVGLAAWLVEKLRSWSDSDGRIDRVFSADDVLTTASLFWFTDTIGSSMRFYRENRLHPNHFADGQRVPTPLGIAAFPADPMPPRSWLERVFTVTRYTTMPFGGHFGAWEAPAQLADEIRAFFRPLRHERDRR